MPDGGYIPILHVPAYNSGNAPVPPFGLVRVTAVSGDGVFTVAAADVDSRNDLYVNGPTAIRPGGYGEVTPTWPVMAGYFVSGDDPAVGDVWGVKAGEFHLRRGYSGYRFLADGVNGVSIVQPASIAASGAGGTTTIEGDLVVEGDSTLEGDLTVDGDTNIAGDTTLATTTFNSKTIYSDSGTSLSVSADLNDLTLVAFPVQFFNVTVNANLTGVVAGVHGQRILRCNTGNATLTIKNEDAGSTAANRIRTPYTTYADVLLPPNFWVEFQYDATISRWRVLWVSSTHLYGEDELESFGSTETDYQMDQRWPLKVITTASGGSTLETIAFGKRGQWYWLQVAAGSDPLTITHQKSGGTAGNLICCPGAIDYVLPQCSGVVIFYDGTYWQVLANQNRPLVILFVDVDLTIPAPAVPEIKVIINIPLTNDRVITLPPASQSKAGTRIEIIDKAGTLGSPYSVTIERAGSDTINGSTSKVMSTPYGKLAFTSDGVSNWTYNPFEAGGSVGLGSTYIGVGDGSGYLSGSANFTNSVGLTGNVTENSTGQVGYKVTHRSNDTTRTNQPGFKVVRSGGTIASPTDTAAGMYMNGLIASAVSSGIETERAFLGMIAASATAVDIYAQVFYSGSWNTVLKIDGSNGVISLPLLTASRILSLDGSNNVVATLDASTLLTTTAAAAAYQPLDSDLTTIAGLTATTDNFIVSVASAWASRTPSQVKTTLGLATGDSPQFTGLEIGHASDTTLTRSSAGTLAVEGNLLYRAGGTDVPITDGGTGASDASTARTNLGLAYAAQGDQETGTSTTTVVAPGTQHFHPSACKAWVVFTVSGVTVTIRASYNVSGVVRNSAGRYTISWGTDFSTAYYSMAGAFGVSGSRLVWDLVSHGTQTADTSGSIIVFVPSTGTATDPGIGMILAFGDHPT